MRAFVILHTFTITLTGQQCIYTMIIRSTNHKSTARYGNHFISSHYVKAKRNKDNINEKGRRDVEAVGRERRRRRVIKTHISVLADPHPPPDSHPCRANGTEVLYQGCAGTGINKGKSLLANTRKMARRAQTISNRKKGTCQVITLN